MSNETLITIIIAAIFLIITIIGLILTYFERKFIKYMHNNYSLFNKVKDIHKKYSSKLIKINRTINIGTHRVNTKYRFDNYRMKFSEYELEGYYNHFKEVEEAVYINNENKNKYSKELITIFDNEVSNINFKDDVYKIKRQEKYLNKFINKNKYNLKEYNNSKHFINHGKITQIIRYTSPKGRNSYKQTVSMHSSDVRSLYKNEVLIPKEKRRIREKRKQNRLYNNKIYFYSDINQPNMICIGQTTRLNVEDRIREQYKLTPFKPYKILHYEYARYNISKKWFSDHDFHNYLNLHGYYEQRTEKGSKTEWFKIKLNDALRLL